MDYYAVSASMLKKMNERAQKEGLNQVLNINDKNAKPETNPSVLDMTKKVLLMRVIPWTHRNVEDKGSIRCMVLFAIEGVRREQHGLLDVPLLYRGMLEKNKIDAKALEETGAVPEPVEDEYDDE